MADPFDEIDDLFESLGDEANFREYVTKFYDEIPKIINDVMGGVNIIDETRLGFAFSTYNQNLEKLSLYLESKNPDHYKRAGSLLHALYSSEIITEINLESSSEELAAGFTRVNLGDAEHILSFVRFYEIYHNEMLAFDFAYRCCASYEESPTTIDFDYFRNVCRYLQGNTNLSVESFFILFKSLMRN